MENTRNFSFMVMCITAIMLFMAWNGDIENLRRKASQPATVNVSVQEVTDNANLIRIKTDVYDMTLNLNGGDIIDTKLLKYAKTVDDPSPISLLQTSSDFRYTLMTGLSEKDGTDTSKGRASYASSAKEYVMDQADVLEVPMVYTRDNVTYEKKFVFKKGSYDIDIRYKITNNGDEQIVVRPFGSLYQTKELPQAEDTPMFMVNSFRGAAFSSDDSKYTKKTFDELSDKDEDIASSHIKTKGGWVSMIQHYFAAAYIGGEDVKNEIYSQEAGNGKAAIIGLYGPTVEIPAHSTADIVNKAWIGPKDQEKMDAIAPHLGLTVDYGWLWFISELLVSTMKFIYGFIGNWGFSIIAITFIVRGILYPLTKAQYISMAKMRLIAPKLQEIRERYQSDPAAYQKATMDLYRTEKVNPASGCLPILIQMPIFIALYWALMESVELRQSPFILWIKDLSVNDPYFILPLLYGLTMYLVQRMSQSNMTMISPLQKKIFLMMPVIFTLMFMTFPAGLTLYWTVSNIFTLLQLKLIYNHLEKIGLHTRNPQKPAGKVKA